MNLRKRNVLRCTLQIAKQLRFGTSRSSELEPQASVILPNGRILVVTKTKDSFHPEKKVYRAVLRVSEAEADAGYYGVNSGEIYLEKSHGDRIRDLYYLIDYLVILNDSVPVMTKRGVYYDNHRIY